MISHDIPCTDAHVPLRFSWAPVAICHYPPISAGPRHLADHLLCTSLGWWWHELKEISWWLSCWKGKTWEGLGSRVINSGNISLLRLGQKECMIWMNHRSFGIGMRCINIVTTCPNTKRMEHPKHSLHNHGSCESICQLHVFQEHLGVSGFFYQLL